MDIQEDDAQTVDAMAVASTMPSLDLFSMFEILTIISQWTIFFFIS